MPDLVLKMGAGAFGKIAALGDFFRSGLSGGFVAAWDTWLQTEIAASRMELGEVWQQRYFSAPIWRFSLATGVAGRDAMLGVVMPSVDRVGRQFPLTLACEIDGSHVAAHMSAHATFAKLENLALATLDELPLEVLKQRMAAITPPPRMPMLVEHGAGLMTLQHGENLAPALAARYLDRPASGSLWSAELDGGMRLMALEGLPTGARFGAMLDPAAALWKAPA